jgi:hypothetical protein
MPAPRRAEPLPRAEPAPPLPAPRCATHPAELAGSEGIDDTAAADSGAT